MAEADLSSRVTPAVALVPQSITTNATTDGVVIDTKGTDSTTFVVNLGALNDINGVISFEESDVVTFGGEENVVSSELVLIDLVADLSFDESDDNKQIVIGLINKKQFIRVVLTTTSTVGANLVSAACILGALRHKAGADTA